MDKWEYLTIRLEAMTKPSEKRRLPDIAFWSAAHFSEQLNAYGEQGWELVSCFCTAAKVLAGNGAGTDGVFATFKRKTEETLDGVD